MTPAEETALDAFIQENLAKGYIRPSKSHIVSPFFFVKKKDRKLRPVQDYRKLNTVTCRDHYPLPRTDNIIDKLKGKKWFTKFDVRWGYNNVRIKEGNEHKAAFVCPKGVFELMGDDAPELTAVESALRLPLLSSWLPIVDTQLQESRDGQVLGKGKERLHFPSS